MQRVGTCKGCGAEVPATATTGRLPSWCAACHPNIPGRPRISICIDCRRRVQAKPRGTWPERCQKCRLAHLAQLKRERRASRRSAKRYIVLGSEA